MKNVLSHLLILIIGVAISFLYFRSNREAPPSLFDTVLASAVNNEAQALLALRDGDIETAELLLATELKANAAILKKNPKLEGSAFEAAINAVSRETQAVPLPTPASPADHPNS